MQFFSLCTSLIILPSWAVEQIDCKVFIYPLSSSVLLFFMNCIYAGSTSIRPSVASRPVAAVGAVRRSWLPRDTSAPSLSSIGDDMMIMGGPTAPYCRPVNTSSYVNQSNPMLSTGVGDGLLISPASTFLPPLNLDPVMAGFVSANPNTMINMMPSNDG